MSGGGNVAHSPISKAVLSDFASMPDAVRACGAAALRVWKWLTGYSRGILARSVARRLRVAETVSLGEKRFVSILQVDGEQFLIGGSTSNIVLLARLDAKPETLGAESFEGVYLRTETGGGRARTDSKNSPEAMR
jgi:flagellar biogenesis protein FliO